MLLSHCIVKALADIHRYAQDIDTDQTNASTLNTDAHISYACMREVLLHYRRTLAATTSASAFDWLKSSERRITNGEWQMAKEKRIAKNVKYLRHPKSRQHWHLSILAYIRSSIRAPLASASASTRTSARLVEQRRRRSQQQNSHRQPYGISQMSENAVLQPPPHLAYSYLCYMACTTSQSNITACLPVLVRLAREVSGLRRG